MLVALLLGLQSAAGPPASDAERLRTTHDCESGGGEPGDIVVCGRPDDDQYRLKPLPERYREDSVIPRAEFDAAGGKIAAEAERKDVGGFPSNRIMLRWKVPL